MPRFSRHFTSDSLLFTAVFLTLTGCSEASSGAAGARDVRAEADGLAEPPAIPADALIGRRIRRLSNAEYGASLTHLLGPLRDNPATTLAPDARQDGFTVNDAQRVDPVLAKQLFAGAERLAGEAQPRIAELAPCPSGMAAEACAQTFIATFGARAYRRPLDDEEIGDLLAVYRAGAADARHEDGITLVIEAVLQSAGMLYVTELGDGTLTATGDVQLTPDEIASALSYLFTASPPDEALREAARTGLLSSAEGRVREAQRLRSTHPESAAQLVGLIHQWLELDVIDRTAKDTQVYPRFAGLRDQIVREAHDFVAAVLSDPGVPNVRALFGADWSIVGEGLGALYDARPRGDGRASVTRRGVLNQAAFLSVQAHAHESTPVLRGALIAKRVACQLIPSPSSLKIEVVPPVPNPRLTTRERFAAHATDLVCSACHVTLDSLGNPFERFDGMGAYRERENGRPVDSSTTINLGLDFDGPFADANALAVAISESEAVRECFARHMFRAVAGHSGEDARSSEDAFIATWQQLPEARRGNLMDTLLAYVGSPLFTQRRAQ